MAMKLLTALLLVATLSYSQEGSIAGRVTSEAGGDPLPGVNVVLQGTVRGGVTDASGEFRISRLSPGTYTLAFSLVGYQRQRLPNVTVAAGGETIVDVTLKEAPVQTDQVVVTASKREQSLQDVPVSVSVIDATEIRTRNSVTLDDALRFVPGVNMTGPQINIRGSSGYSLGGGSRVLMLVDGIPFITGDTGELIYEMIPASQIDRIEVVKGASSALYGSNALGGVINIITKPVSETPEASVRMFGGFYNKPAYEQWRWTDKRRYLHGQSAAFSQKFGEFGASLFISRYIDDGYRRNDSRSRYNISFKARQEFSPASALTIGAGFLQQHTDQFVFWRSLDSALIPPLTNQNDNQQSTRFHLNGTYNSVMSGNVLFTVKGMWSHNRWGYQQFLDGDRSFAVVHGFRTDISARVLPDDLHTITAGVDANVDLISGDTFERRTIGGLALYGQDEIALGEKWTATIGIRTDFQSVGLSGEGLQLNPKAAVVFNPVEGTTLRASFGRGFRIPSVAEAFIAAGGGLIRGVPNTDLKPERSIAFEAGVSHVLAGAMSIDAAFFRSEYDNLIEPGLSVSGQNVQVQWRNVTSARVQGFETAWRAGLFGNMVLASVGYTYVWPEDLTKKQILKYRPRHLLYTNLSGNFGWLRLGGDFRFVSRVDNIDDELVNSGIIPDGNERVDILVADFRVGAEIPVMGFTLSAMLNVRNAFQRNYVEVIGNMMPPRTYLLSLDARW